MEKITYSKSYLNRGAGILLPISALPSNYGIGTLGKESYKFVDFLTRIGSIYWQVLPIGPTSYGDSPYQSFSAFAGNPYFIDLDFLVEEQLLKKEEIDAYLWQVSEDKVDYGLIYKSRFKILKTAYLRSSHKNKKEYLDFCKDNRYWLEDYCLYMAVKTHFDNHEWLLWDDDIKNRKPEAIEKYQDLLQDEINFWAFVQYKFYEQWNKLKAYTNSKGIQIIGDIPLYVAMDSADVWAHHEQFELDERKNPINVAGVPPDLFSEYGQRWGNPLYRWDVMEKDDFTWWRERMKASAALYDVIRIDHFIGMVNYYSIPAENETAVNGCWKEGPGRKLTDIIMESIGEAKIIAEDLGVLTPNVIELIEETGFPGMKILEFGLDGPIDNPYLLHNFKTSNVVAYTGTHDNETLVGYLEKKNPDELEFICKYFNGKVETLPDTIIRALYASVADVIIVQMQDLLKLDNSARMNYPSTIGGNWQWRLMTSQYELINEKSLYELAYLYGRINT
ncbi:4-alpha-glucanotransferase [Herbinix luporum]|jgi:4-alpha-glucanotransferase|uniref:4-alpha-glucanotransferase n=2 Tax=Herbinix luporum TaxID=1679721 RepID=A0A0K8J422_9FIRM|nr:4-alpha-glucanotransferase [Herbinix luporum]